MGYLFYCWIELLIEVFGNIDVVDRIGYCYILNIYIIFLGFLEFSWLMVCLNFFINVLYLLVVGLEKLVWIFCIVLVLLMKIIVGYDRIWLSMGNDLVVFFLLDCLVNKILYGIFILDLYCCRVVMVFFLFLCCLNFKFRICRFFLGCLVK